MGSYGDITRIPSSSSSSSSSSCGTNEHWESADVAETCASVQYWIRCSNVSSKQCTDLHNCAFTVRTGYAHLMHVVQIRHKIFIVKFIFTFPLYKFHK
jgi:hypothetical protein